jgi:chromosome segregation ATPase
MTDVLQAALLRSIEDFKTRIAPMFEDVARHKKQQSELINEIKDLKGRLRDQERMSRRLKETAETREEMESMMAQSLSAAETLERQCSNLRQEQAAASKDARKWQERAEALELENTLLQDEVARVQRISKHERDAHRDALKEKEDEIAKLKATLVQHKKIVRGFILTVNTLALIAMIRARSRGKRQKLRKQIWHAYTRSLRLSNQPEDIPNLLIKRMYHRAWTWWASYWSSLSER